MKQFLKLLLFFCLTKSGYAQVIAEPAFHHLTPAQLGLKSFGWVDWDKNGLMWGTYKDGFYSYDGYSTKKHTLDSSYLSKTLSTCTLDSKNNLWLSYDDGSGVTRYNTLTGEKTNYPSDSVDQHKLPIAIVTSIREDSKGNTWILTWGEGLIKIDAETGVCKRFVPHLRRNDNSIEFANRVRDMIEMPDGRFLIVFFGNEGVDFPPVFFDPNTGVFTDFPIRNYISEKEDLLNNISFALRICHFIYKDKQQNLWFGTYSGLIFFDATKHQFQRVSGIKKSVLQNQDNARAYIIDERERIWIATPNSGVMVVDPKTREAQYVTHDINVNTSVADNNIRLLKKDPDGNIWVGTGQAFSIYNPLIQQFDAVSWSGMSLEYGDRSLQRIPVNQLLVRGNGTLYITSASGINVYDAEKKQLVKKIEPKYLLPKSILSTIQPISQNYISDIKHLEGENYFLINNQNVPARWNAASDKLQTPADWLMDSVNRGCFFILFKHLESEKEIYLYDWCRGGIYHYNLKTNKLERFYKQILIDNRGSHYSYVLPSGKWLVSDGDRQFCIIDPIKKTHKIYGPDHKDTYFPDSTIRCAYLDKRGTIWIATSNGLYTFNETTGKTEHVSKKLGWNYGAVNTIIEDKNGVFWLGLDRQLLKWDPKTNKTFLFGSELGLKTGDFIPAVAQHDNKGKIYMAAVNGVLIFDPEAIVVPPTIPILVLSALSIKEDTLNKQRLNAFTAQKQILNWNDNFLNFEFASSQIYTPLPHHFYYRLKGLDSTWQDNGISNKVRYTNLAAGSYVLEVKIRNSYEIMSSVLKIPFVIKPPFWLTWWFYVIVIVVFAFSGYKIVKYRERSFIRKQAILEMRIRERTAEVVAKAEEITHQKDIIQEKNKELTDSIQYALRIQQSILPDHKQISQGLKNYFIFYKPKDIVSGDFFWYSKQKDSVLWAVVDCTGHGVPGGFMSMLGSGLLNQIVNEELKLQPNEILNNLRDRVIIALKQTGEFGESNDGMDITLCRYIPSEKKIQFAGAHNPLYIVRKGELMELNPDKQPIGIHIGDKKSFTLQEMDVEKEDMIYMSSDGYADQFGGPKGKKFKSGTLEKLFIKIATEDLQNQNDTLQSTFGEWKKDYEQLDDVCLFGVRI